jgi:hypothetical protein
MDTIAERLGWAIKHLPPSGVNRGVSLFQKRMASRPSARGTSLSRIHAYLNPKNEADEPSIRFLRNAAEILDVRFDWLAWGNGPMTEQEARSTKAGEVLQAYRDAFSGSDPLASTFLFLDRIDPAVRLAFVRVIEKADKASATPAGKDTAAVVQQLLFAPLQFWRKPMLEGEGHKLRPTREWASDFDFDTYATAMLHALSLALPSGRSPHPVDSAIPKGDS